jgi:hydroxymethylbilane synthase
VAAKIVIGTRGSKLALWQTDWVRRELEQIHPDLDVEVQIISTKGDRVLGMSLPALGAQGKGLFTKELEDAISDGRIDLAVHSLKDLPTELPDGLHIGAICEREDVRDALVVKGKARSLAELGDSAVIGTSSLRRQAQLKILKPGLVIVAVRGNVDTRLRKLDDGEYDAILLAAAGLRRLGYGDRITEYLDEEVMLPAVGQGALAIESRSDDERISRIIAGLEHAPTRTACAAERAFLKGLGGGCLVPIAAHAHVSSSEITLTGLVAAPDGTHSVKGIEAGPLAEPEKLGLRLASALLERGAADILARS